MKLVIIDRDGVINHESADFIKSPDEWQPIAGSIDAIARLNHAGFRVAVATEQPGLAQGVFTIGDLNAIHHKLFGELAKAGGHLDGIFFCPHGADDGCSCRTPSPGLFYEISRRFRTQLYRVPVITRLPTVIDAAKEVDARPVLVQPGAEVIKAANDVPAYANLAAAVDAIVTAQEH
jgi:D-glycero-D-manno-heptose 1,7-bisphosphate phosphatase